jgi:Dullard-like phosphatase family protein
MSHFAYLKKKSSCEFENIEECNSVQSNFQKYSIDKSKGNPFFCIKTIKTVGLSKSVEIVNKDPQFNASFPTEDDITIYKKNSNSHKLQLHFESATNKQENLVGDQAIPTISVISEELKDSTISMNSSSLLNGQTAIKTKEKIPIELLQPFTDIKNNLIDIKHCLDNPPPIIYFPRHPKKILVLDMDETLSHNLSPEEHTALTVYNVYYKTGEYAKVVLRPYYKSFLDLLSKYYTFVIFTAGMKKYAESIVRLIDPKHKYFLCELYRNDCNNVNNTFYAKDLRQVGDLSQTMIIDNCITSFVLQMDNGIHIKPFYGDPNDNELALLVEYFQSIRGVADVRSELRKRYGNSLLLENFLYL